MKRSRQLISKIWANSWLFLLAAGMIVLMVAAVEHTKSMRCSDVVITIDHDAGTFFVEEQHVRSMIQERLQDSLLGLPLDTVNFGAIEQNIEQDPYVASANIHTGMQGKLKVDVRQRQPIVRVIADGGINYYLDENGRKMPVASHYTARVPVATVQAKSGKGQFRRDSAIHAGLFQLGSYIDEHPFWQAQIGQIVVTQNLEYKLVPRLGPHKIMFGNIEDIEQKFNKLMVFYEEGLKRKGWGEYDKVSVKYEDQVIGAR